MHIDFSEIVQRSLVVFGFINAKFGMPEIKAELNLFKQRFVPKMKLTLPIVQNFFQK